MRRGLVIVLGIFLFSFSLVAAGVCEDDQTIMRLFSTDPNVATNSHAAISTTSDYTYDICHNDIFLWDYTLEDPHDCDADYANKVLFLSAASNAHVSDTKSADYNVDVCYGNMKCNYVPDSTGGCADDEKIVARISGASNAHISDDSDTDYGLKVCCKSVAVYWANMEGEEVTVMNVGDKVKLVAKGIANTGSFTVIEDDLPLGTELPGNDDTIISGIANESSDNGISSYGVWEITFEDLENTDDLDHFYFEAGGERSEYLEITKTEGDAVMTVTIDSPYCGEVFFNGTDMPINISVNDSDDTVTGNVSVNGTLVDTFDSDGLDINYFLKTPGNIQVVVEVVNSRGEIGKTVSNIMVLDTSYVNGREYVAACIASPIDFSRLGTFVEFDASTTRAVRITTDGTYTESTDLLIPGTDNFIWDWTFTGALKHSVNDSDDDTYDNANDGYIFGVKFPTSGDNSAVLKVEI